jgi:hypothetical protein
MSLGDSQLHKEVSVMKKLSVLLVCIAPLLFVLGSCSCEAEKGACVVGSGIFATCADGYTAGKCDMVFGDLGTFYEGVTCEELGFDRAAVSMLMVSELFYRKTDTGGELQWVELFNASAQPIDLAGYQLVCRDAGSGTTVVTLDGVIGRSGTFVVGGPDSDESNGFPAFDQIVSFDSGHLLAAETSALVALLRPGEKVGVDCPLSAIVLGDVDDDDWDVLDGDGGVSHVIGFVPGASLERTAWPEDEWRSRSVPDPNRVSDELAWILRR